MKALAFNRDRCCHLALYLWLILFHYLSVEEMASWWNDLAPKTNQGENKIQQDKQILNEK
jgi:hypothetical protein